MKKILVITLALLLALSVFVSCKKNDETPAGDSTPNTTAAASDSSTDTTVDTPVDTSTDTTVETVLDTLTAGTGAISDLDSFDWDAQTPA